LHYHIREGGRRWQEGDRRDKREGGEDMDGRKFIPSPLDSTYLQELVSHS
jgi:hypothetical protein